MDGKQDFFIVKKGRKQMKRSAATVKNSIWSVASQVIVCVLSLFSRRVMIETIGVEGVGLNAFLTSVITMLSLAELGIGTAIVYHMYAPLARGDNEKITQLMNFYKTVYRVIAGVIFLIGLALLPFMPKIVNDTSYTNGYIYIIFMLFLIQTCSSYLFTYKRSLLSADQKQYIIVIYDLVYKISVIVLGILVLKLTHELAYYLILLTAGTLIENILISKRVDILYPYVNEKTLKLKKQECVDIARDVKNIFIGKISNVITNSTDSILINIFAGTVKMGLYSNYNIILGTLLSAINQLSSSMKASIGNLIALESKEHIERVFERLVFMMFLIGSFCACCLTGLIDPFISIAFGKNLTLDRLTVYVCIANLYLTAAEIPAWTMVTSAGLFKYDKYIAILSTLINLVVSFVLGKAIGMPGILIGTSCTFFTKLVLKTVLFYRTFLNAGMLKVFAKNFLYMSVTVLQCALISFAAKCIPEFNEYARFVVLAAVSALIPVITSSALFFKTDEFSYCLNLLKNSVNHIKER